ncbi:unnamed protein product [Amoebophrya sp. A25]|nr:unnamed protein product [Amoebophrya sp. A25]|eukprot:GSA25T00018182001.1
MAPKLKDVQEELAREKAKHAETQKKLDNERKEHDATRTVLQEHEATIQRTTTTNANDTAAEKERWDAERLELQQKLLEQKDEAAAELARQLEELRDSKNAEMREVEGRLREALDALATAGSKLIESQTEMAAMTQNIEAEVADQLATLQPLFDQHASLCSATSGSPRGHAGDVATSDEANPEDDKTFREDDARTQIIDADTSSVNEASCTKGLLEDLKEIGRMTTMVTQQMHTSLERESRNHDKTKAFLKTQLAKLQENEAMERKPIELLHKGALTARPRYTHEFDEMEFQLKMSRLKEESAQLQRSTEAWRSPFVGNLNGTNYTSESGMSGGAMNFRGPPGGNDMGLQSFSYQESFATPRQNDDYHQNESQAQGWEQQENNNRTRTTASASGIYNNYATRGPSSNNNVAPVSRATVPASLSSSQRYYPDDYSISVANDEPTPRGAKGGRSASSVVSFGGAESFTVGVNDYSVDNYSTVRGPSSAASRTSPSAFSHKGGGAPAVDLTNTTATTDSTRYSGKRGTIKDPNDTGNRSLVEVDPNYRAKSGVSGKGSAGVSSVGSKGKGDKEKPLSSKAGIVLDKASSSTTTKQGKVKSKGGRHTVATTASPSGTGSKGAGKTSTKGNKGQLPPVVKHATAPSGVPREPSLLVTADSTGVRPPPTLLQG